MNEFKDDKVVAFVGLRYEWHCIGIENKLPEVLEDLINRRYNANKPLIITSNLPKTFFINPSKDNVVNRIVSRLKEMAAEPIDPGETEKAELSV